VDIAKLMHTELDGSEILQIVKINMPNSDYSNLKFENMKTFLTRKFEIIGQATLMRDDKKHEEKEI
jgi:hypothetical protein